jgi:hypothetical protein
MRRIFAILAVLPLAACVIDTTPGDPNDACGAPGLQSLIGQPESVVAAMTFAQPVRILHPGDAMTMDFIPARLNILIDAQGRIERIYCG